MELWPNWIPREQINDLLTHGILLGESPFEPESLESISQFHESSGFVNGYLHVGELFDE